MIDSSQRVREWRSNNPEKYLAQSERRTAKRIERMQGDPEYAETVRAQARTSDAERRRKKAEGAPDGWKILVRMVGEKRSRAIVELAYNGTELRGIQRQNTYGNAPKRWNTEKEAQEFAAYLVGRFPSKIESTRVEVL